MNIRITGSNGYLGKRISEELKAQGHHVCGIERKFLYGPPELLMKEIDGAEIIINLAGAPILLFASEHERAQLAPLFEKLHDRQVIDLIGQDLLTAAACIARARLFIGNDSGLMHIAAATGTPTLALFGPGWESIYGPWGEKTAVVRKEPVEVLLARLPHAAARAPNLMEEISVEDVWQAAQKLL